MLKKYDLKQKTYTEKVKPMKTQPSTNPFIHTNELTEIKPSVETSVCVTSDTISLEGKFGGAKLDQDGRTMLSLISNEDGSISEHSVTLGINALYQGLLVARQNHNPLSLQIK